MNPGSPLRRLQNRPVQFLLDAVVIAAAFVVAHLLRFNGWPPAGDAARMWRLLPFLCIGHLWLEHWLGVDRRIWRYIGVMDSLALAQAAACAAAPLLLLRFLSVWKVLPFTSLGVPIGIILINFVLVTAGLVSLRLAWRIRFESHQRSRNSSPGRARRALLVGAGSGGVRLLTEIMDRRDLGLKAVGFLDDDPGKLRATVRGLQVLDRIAALPAILDTHQVDEVIITMAGPSRDLVNFVLETCGAKSVPVRIIPGIFEILSGKVTISRIRPVEIADLLGRGVADFTAWQRGMAAEHHGRCVLVTGAGGSIGSELCRQLLHLNPSALVLLDKDEFGIFEVERELLRHPARRDCRIHPVVADLRQQEQIEQIMRTLQPQIIYHAAAHKHVPLMEANVCEAVLNNVGGAEKLLAACACAPLEGVVLVSSDKAVRPANVMGATKRVAEILFQIAAQSSLAGKRVATVRFGNVLGSRGSVVPLFQEQINRGGPVTLTHPDMERYFMTIPEAAQLIVAAGVLGRSAEIFVLDMGKQVRMLDLARAMIRLSGLVPDEDIKIVYTGIRPGEKLREELYDGERLRSTTFDKISVADSTPVDAALAARRVRDLLAAARSGDAKRVRALLRDWEIGYPPAEAPHAARAARA